jgi:hypothetical protein
MVTDSVAVSRINHDCRPSADYHFDAAVMAQHVTATRTIMAGEEITIPYLE